MRRGKQGKVQKGGEEPRTTPKPAGPSGVSAFVSEETQEWVRRNWKTTLLVAACTLLVFFMKIHEENFDVRAHRGPQENLYDVLGLDATASAKDIKRQYTKLAMELHPDKHPNCASCPDKFQRVSQAYEVLSDEDKKRHYDETEGVLETIKSSSKSLHPLNYQKLVLESPYLWILQVYSDTSGTSQTFAGFWEEYVDEYDYLKFGRIHALAQRKLLPRLPFAVDELPFVFSMGQDRSSEILEYNFDESPNTRFHMFVRKAIGVHHETADAAWLAKTLARPPAKPTLLFLQTDALPPVFSYLALKFSDVLGFYVSQPSTTKALRAQLKDPKATMAVFNPARRPTLPPVREFEVPASKTGVKSVYGYAMFGLIPRRLIRPPATLLPAPLHGRTDLRHPPEVTSPASCRSCA